MHFIAGNNKMAKSRDVVVGLLLLVVTCSRGTSAARILMLPYSLNSHVIYFSRLGEGLARLGHQVELFAPSNAYIPHHVIGSNFTITTFQVDEEVPFMSRKETSDVYLRSAISSSQWEKLQILQQFIPDMIKAFDKDCLSLLKNQELMAKIKSTGFQFAIMDPLLCSYLIPMMFNIPYASFWVGRLPMMYRVPRLPSFVSALPFSDHMTFNQRFMSFAFACLELYAQWCHPSNSFAKFENILPDSQLVSRSSIYEVLQNSSLWLYLEDVSVGYPRPNMPNTMSIGDIIVADQTIRPLSRELEQFLNDFPNGCILVSFGSIFDHLPEFLEKGFCDAFQKLKYGVIWKLKHNTGCADVPNILTLPWVPQNDLLAHPNIRLFITHGGLSSTMEHVYHGKPAIIFPLAFDQPENAQIAADKGYGIHMELGQFDVDDLVSNINKIMEDPEFTKKAQFASAILKNKQNSPAERVSFMIDHVLKYGDRHLRTGAFHLWIFQYLMFDIFLAIVGIFVVSLLMFAALICICFRCVKFTIKKCSRKRKNE